MKIKIPENVENVSLSSSFVQESSHSSESEIMISI
jgi:hypothetical protein